MRSRAQNRGRGDVGIARCGRAAPTATVVKEASEREPASSVTRGLTRSDSCKRGRIDRDDREGVADMRLRLRDAIDGHRARFDDIQDGDAMHDECDDHHGEMGDVLDETEDRLRSGGMMNGSGTGVGMM